MISVYQPYRAKALSREQLEALNVLRPWIAVRNVAVAWAVILLCWWLVWRYPGWPVVAVAVPVVGCQLYSLMIIAHDGLHRRLFNNRKTNDFFCDVCLLGPIGAITRINRRNHILHHRTLGLDDDPDRHKYSSDNKHTLFQTLWFFVGARTFLKTAGNVFLHKNVPHKAQNAAISYGIRDAVIIFAWQFLLIGGLSYFIGWWAYPVLFLLPFALFAYLADIFRVFCEHSYAEPDLAAQGKKRLITFKSHWLERLFLAPHHMNYHAAHHLWPSIPYYHLPRADALLRQSGHGDAGLEWRGSYLAYFYRYMRWVCSMPKKEKNVAAS